MSSNAVQVAIAQFEWKDYLRLSGLQHPVTVRRFGRRTRRRGGPLDGGVSGT